MQKRKKLIGLAAFLSALAVSATGAPRDGMTRLGKHLSPALRARIQERGRLQATTPLELALTLKPGDPAGLEEMIRRVHNPGDALYGNFLTPEQFAQIYAPSAEDVAQVTSYLSAHQLRVTRVHPNRLVVDLEGAASDIEKAFNLELHQYQDTDGKIAHAPDRDPSVPLSIASKIVGVHGLNGFSLRKPHAQVRGPRTPRPTARRSTQAAASGSSTPAAVGTADATYGGLKPAELRTAYGFDKISGTGSGQILALYELDDYMASDIEGYKTTFGLSTNTIVTRVPVDGGVESLDDTGGRGEVTLDIELAMATAPGLAEIRVYEADQTSTKSADKHSIDVYSAIANDSGHLASTVSISWGQVEAFVSDTSMQGEHLLFQQMAVQGQSVFAASGDCGAYAYSDGSGGCISNADQYTLPSGASAARYNVEYPATDPYVVAVGGTDLTLGALGAYSSETSWGELDPGTGDAIGGGGGGISILFPIPSWQKDANISVNTTKGSASFRMVPDVSLYADPMSGGYAIYLKDGNDKYDSKNDNIQEIGGTSCGAPIWAAYTALINEARATKGYPNLGFPNLAIYPLASNGATYSQLFNDIKDNSTNYKFPAVTGYDLTTGWGSMKSLALYTALSDPTQPFAPVLSVKGHNHSNVINWNPIAKATSYTLSRSASASGSFDVVSSGLAATSYTDLGLTNGTTYYYKVMTVTDAATSLPSPVESGTPVLGPPGAPTELKIESVQ